MTKSELQVLVNSLPNIRSFYRSLILYKEPGSPVTKTQLDLIDTLHKYYDVINPYLPKSLHYINTSQYDYKMITSPLFFRYMLANSKFRMLKPSVSKYKLINHTNVFECLSYCIQHYSVKAPNSKTQIPNSEVVRWLKSQITNSIIKDSLSHKPSCLLFLPYGPRREKEILNFKYTFQSLNVLLDHLPTKTLHNHKFIDCLLEKGHTYHSSIDYLHGTRFI
jgi:hypothetical protein